MKINKSKVIQAVLCCLLWSTAIPVLKTVYSELNITGDDFYGRLVLAGMRFMLAGIMLLIYSVMSNRQVPIVQSEFFAKVFIFALLSTSLQYLFFYTGVMNAGAINGVLIDSTKPFIIIVLAHFFC